MILVYDGKIKEEEVITHVRDCKLKLIKGNPTSKSKVIKGENLEVLKYLLTEGGLKGKIDLIYIDPPFSTNNVFRISKDKANSISRSNVGNIAYNDSLVGPEFLEFIRERIIFLRELLSDKGSIYVHIDYKIGHYIKILMDEIFGKHNFLNDITRIKCNPKNFERKAFGNIKDMILVYSKTGNHIWNTPREILSDKDIKRLFKKVDKNGRRYTTVPVHAPGETKDGLTGQSWRTMMPPKGRHWRSAPCILDKLDKEGLIEWSKTGVPRKIIYADEHNGKLVQDILKFKDSQTPSYPTEKNLELLKLIVSTSSGPDSIVLDCFCGSGTTLQAAQELGRHWIGIDNSEEAINVVLDKFVTQLDKFEYLEQETY